MHINLLHQNSVVWETQCKQLSLQTIDYKENFSNNKCISNKCKEAVKRVMCSNIRTMMVALWWMWGRVCLVHWRVCLFQARWNNLTASGKKLLRSLVVVAWMLWYLLPSGRWLKSPRRGGRGHLQCWWPCRCSSCKRSQWPPQLFSQSAVGSWCLTLCHSHTLSIVPL